MVGQSILELFADHICGHRSGSLNAKQRELAELQALAQRRLKSARVNFAEGMQAARETRRDLDYTSKKISYVFQSPFTRCSGLFCEILMLTVNFAAL